MKRISPLSKALLAGATALTLYAPAVHAQPAWPAKPVTLVVPFTAGGNVDVVARMVAEKLGPRIGQTVVVDNVAGAGGAIGIGRVAQAAPDGYTLAIGPDSPIVIGKLVNPAAFKFDPLKDLAPVTLLQTAPMVLVTRPTLPAQSYADFVRLAKAEPGKLNYATSGIGTVLQLAMELLKQRSGIFVTHIPYRGGAQIATDLMGNQIDSAMMVSTSVIPHVQSGKLKALGVTDGKRLAALPQVPTFAEMPGLKGFEMNSWIGVFAPARTPPEVVHRLNQELNAVLKLPDIQAKLREQGAVPASTTEQEFAKFVRTEYERNAQIVRTANIKAE